MSKGTILIVEDEMLIATQIKQIVERHGYTVAAIAVSYTTAVSWVLNEKIDAVLLDINIKGKKTGIDVGIELFKMGIPFIYLTSHSDAKTVAFLLDTKPVGYITKPVNPIMITTTLDLLFQRNQIQEERVLITSGKKSIVINLGELKYIESSRVYVILHKDNKQVVVRSTLKQMLVDFPENSLIPVSRSILVNNARIVERSQTNVILDNGENFPITKRYRINERS